MATYLRMDTGDGIMEVRVNESALEISDQINSGREALLLTKTRGLVASFIVPVERLISAEQVS